MRKSFNHSKNSVSMLIVFTCVLSLVWTCRKEVDTTQRLPPYSENGSETFACRVNGVIFTPQEHDWFSNPSIQSVNYLKSTNKSDSGKYIFYLSGMMWNDVFDYDIDIQFKVKRLTVGTYKLQNREGVFVSRDVFYETDGVNNTGEVTIRKFDTINKIMSGTFQFDALHYKQSLKDTLNHDVIHITEGEFDMHYN